MAAKRWMLVGWVALVAAAVAPARADVSPLDRLVDLSVQNAPLSAVVAQLSADTGATVEAQPSVADVCVTLDLHGVTLHTALDMLCEVAGLTVGQIGDKVILRSTVDRMEGVRPLPPANPPLKRDQVKKIKYACTQLLPSQLAGYFGRPAIHHTGAAGGLQPAAPTKYSLSLTPVMLSEHDTADQKMCSDMMLAEARKRFEARWGVQAASGIGVQGVEPIGAVGTAAFGATGRAPIEVPAGVLAVIGYDPGKSLIAVGRPEAVDKFELMAKELDRNAGPVELRAHYYVVPASAVAGLGLGWMTQTTPSGTGQLRYAIGAVNTVASKLSDAAGKAAFDADPVTVDNGRPAVLALSRRLGGATATDSCFSTPLDAKDVEGVLATSDLKVVPWAIGGADAHRFAVQIEPVFGDVLVALKQSGNEVAKSTALPRSYANLGVALGQTLVFGGVAPSAGWKSPDACRLLSGLPLCGDLYRGAGDPAPESVVIVTVTPLVP
jgi:hypothetical protein